MSRITSRFTALWAFFKRHPRTSLLALVVVVALLVFVSHAQAPATTEGTTSSDTPTVEVATVAALASGSASLNTLGEVRSVSQAELMAQKSGQVTRVYVTAGQYVAPGTLLGEIENASERAAVLQAEGALAAAEAQRAKVLAGARSEDRTSAAAQAENSATARASAEDAAWNTYTQSYTTAYNAVYTYADQFFKKSYTVRPSIQLPGADYNARQALSTERVALTDMLDTWHSHTTAPHSNEELDARLVEAQDALVRVKTLVDTIGHYVSEQRIDIDVSAGEKASQEAVIAAAQQSLDGAKAAVAGARSSLAQARTAATVASEAARSIETGARPEDIQAADASVVSARGALAAARALLEKSVIRSPIGGEVTTLALTQGDYVNPGTVLAVVANTRAQEIQASVSEEVQQLLTVGAAATIDGVYEGQVTSIEPGLDPATKKARVHVALTSPDTTLTNGQYVSVSFAPKEEAAQAATAPRDGYALPIESIKVLPSGLALLSVNASSTLEAHMIPEGTIVGDRMLVKDGVTPDLLIVRDVRGLSVGEQVAVADTN